MGEDLKFPAQCQTSLAEALRPELFKAMSDPVRISIIAMLATQKEPSTVSQIAAHCGIDFSGVSRHLKILYNAEIVTMRKEGRTSLYRLKTHELVETLQGLAKSLLLCAGANER